MRRCGSGYIRSVPLPALLLDQLSRPSGRLASLTGVLLSSINAHTILAGISALDLRAGQRVIEVGFGGGLSLPLLLRAVGERGQVFASETSHELLAKARRRFIVQRLQGRLQVEHAVVESLPLGDGSFDAALSLDSISCWTDLDKGMRELARVLAVDGRLVLSVADPEQAERLGDRLSRYSFELLEIRRTVDGISLLVARRADDGL